jgi:hypothetical protein
VIGMATDKPKFDPIAVGDKIAAHIAKADEAVSANREHSMAAGALLLDVAQNYPKHLEAICERIGLGLSRRKELLMIAGGRKTLEKSRADNKARQDRHRAKKRALPPPEPKPLQPPATASLDPEPKPLQPPVTANLDPEPKPLHPPVTANLDPDGKASKAKAKRSSDRALAEFRFAAGQYLPDMTADDRRKALELVSGMIARLNQEVAA